MTVLEYILLRGGFTPRQLGMEEEGDRVADSREPQVIAPENRVVEDQDSSPEVPR